MASLQDSYSELLLNLAKWKKVVLNRMDSRRVTEAACCHRSAFHVVRQTTDMAPEPGQMEESSLEQNGLKKSYGGGMLSKECVPCCQTDYRQCSVLHCNSVNKWNCQVTMNRVVQCTTTSD